MLFEQTPESEIAEALTMWWDRVWEERHLTPPPAEPPSVVPGAAPAHRHMAAEIEERSPQTLRGRAFRALEERCACGARRQRWRLEGAPERVGAWVHPAALLQREAPPIHRLTAEEATVVAKAAAVPRHEHSVCSEVWTSEYEAGTHLVVARTCRQRCRCGHARTVTWPPYSPGCAPLALAPWERA